MSECRSPLDERFSNLIAVIRDAESAVLAFSGGVDSSFLLYAMLTSGIRTLAVTAMADTVPPEDLEAATIFARNIGVEHVLIKTNELHSELFVRNTPERCFHCKDELFRKIFSVIEGREFRFVFDGNNADDLKDYRPGMRASSLHGVRSPLAECGLTKEDIRTLSRKRGLTTWDRPSSPCLSSRIPYGQRITTETLQRIHAAEFFLKSLGLKNVRVRSHENSARIEVDESEIPSIIAEKTKKAIVEKLKSLGYQFVSVDLEGYTSGKMNRPLSLPDSKQAS